MLIIYVKDCELLFIHSVLGVCIESILCAEIENARHISFLLVHLMFKSYT